MTLLKEINFHLKVTNIHRRSIDKLVAFTDSYKQETHQELIASLDQEDFDVSAFQSLYVEVPEIEFSLYALSIVHCYSILENNRKLILLTLQNLSEGQRKNLHDIRVVTQCLKGSGIIHEKIRCFKTMNEFRLVNNAIKHDRFSLSKEIKTESGVKYGAKKLRSLYINKAKNLETYLSDLYKRTKS